MRFLRKPAAWSVFFILLIPAISLAQTNDATLRVLVISEDEGLSVIGANIVITRPQGDTLHTGVTNVEGFHEFPGIAPGTYQIHISYIGFETHHATLTLQENETRVYKPALARATIEIDELIIGVKRGVVRREAGRQTITARDINLVPSPGPGGDLSMYLQTLASVVTSGDRGGQFFIRGGTPAQNLVLVDKMPVIKPFHISTLFSAFPQDIISSVEMYAGGFGAEYSGAVSSVIDVTLRQGNMRQFESRGAVSPYIVSFQAEGPLSKDKQSLLVTGRHSVIEQTGPGLTGRDVPLLFYDMLARYSVNWPGFTCNATGLHTYDQGEINPERNVELSWTNTAFGIRCLGYAEELKHVTDFTIGWSGFNSSEGGIDATIRQSGMRMGYLRLDNGGELWGMPVDYGFEWNVTHYLAQLDDPFPEITGAPVRYADLGSSIDKYESIFRGYVSLRWQPNEYLTIMPGIVSQNRHSDMHLTLEPRLRLAWQPGGSDRREFSLAAGRYFQMKEGITDESDAGTVFYIYKPIDEEDPLPESLHGILGYRHTFSNAIEANLEGYVKSHKNIPVAEWTQEPENTVRTALADGLAYGVDMQIEFSLYPFYLSLGYGWAEVTYEALTEDLAAWLDRPVFTYNPSHDRRHQFNIISSYEFYGFTASVNWQFSSGTPFTRIFAYDIALDVPDQHPLEDRGRLRTLYSEPFDGRLPNFHRLDISINRSFQLSPAISTELEIGAINSYNVTNVFYFDVNTLQQVNQLPLLPYVSFSTSFN